MGSTDRLRPVHTLGTTHCCTSNGDRDADSATHATVRLTRSKLVRVGVSSLAAQKEVYEQRAAHNLEHQRSARRYESFSSHSPSITLISPILPEAFRVYETGD
jgi:hypothetical protein